MSGRQLELQSLRRELNSARDLLGQLEARLQALEEESGFELVYPLPGASAEGPESPSPGSGGGYLSRGPLSPPVPGSGGARLSQAASSSPLPGSGGAVLSQGPTSPDRPGSGGGDLSLTSDLADEVFPDRSSRANPGPPHSAFRTHVAQEVGLFLRRALEDPVPPEPSGWRPHVRHHDHHVAPRFPVRGSCWAPTLGCASSGFSLPVPFYSPREPFCPGNPSSGLGPLPLVILRVFLTSVQDAPSAGVEPPSSPESFPRRA